MDTSLILFGYHGGAGSLIQFMWILYWRFEVSQAFVMIALIMPRLALIGGIIPECYIGTVVTYLFTVVDKNALPCGRKDFNEGFRSLATLKY